ncbi:MAG: hypothetical protein MJE77_08740 [Proteobacteria bacterium]|nr:hypothetical protein [Pseudomonadota bacterium]
MMTKNERWRFAPAGYAVFLVALLTGHSCSDSALPHCLDDQQCSEGSVCADTQDLCIRSHCGNGERDPGEVCDDGNNLSGDNCSADCQSDETCGNGIIDRVKGEACDDGNNLDGDDCRANCTSVLCGNGVVDEQFFEACDQGVLNSDEPDAMCRTNCQPMRCGDGIRDAGEACDDGNLSANDGCTPDCQSDEICGNGYPDISVGELCDDGNLLNHDGCTSSCLLEQPAWVESTRSLPAPIGGQAEMVYDAARGRMILFTGRDTWGWDGAWWTRMTLSGSSPPTRSGHTMVYDSVRGRIVLFGGNRRNDVWEWDGMRWIDVTRPGGSPVERDLHAVAYDAARGQTILFGGYRGNSKTWAWDGANWTDVTPTGASPQARWHHAMVYDARRDRIVLFSGTGVGEFNDTWEWDGTSWTQVTPDGPSPSVRWGHAMAYDAARSRVVLFGGASPDWIEYNDTWEWDGTRWIEMAPSGRLPSPRWGHTMAYDSARGRVVLFHQASDGETIDTWEWDGTQWTEVTPTNFSPSARWNHAMTYDAARGHIVLFGGSDANGAKQNDTWQWMGTRWTQTARDGVLPPARSGHAMAYDEVRHWIVLFGGNGANGAKYGDTWIWDGAEWIELFPPGPVPAARAGHAMSYDAARDRIVLFGGDQRSDTWEWNGKQWIAMAPASPSPRPLEHHAMAYDKMRGRVILFGGKAFSPYDSMWEWDGEQWTRITPIDLSPSPRSSHTMAYNPARNRVVLFAGDDHRNRNDTWEWDGTSWTPVSPPYASPPARFGHAMAYDAARGHMVVFGGYDFSTYYDDTWHFRYEGDRRESEACLYGFDTDGDSLIGCDDSDCWGYCTPFCPPGTTCDWSAPHCGDDVCDSYLETCRLCPQDCGLCPLVCGDFICDPGETEHTCPGDCRAAAILNKTGKSP